MSNSLIFRKLFLGVSLAGLAAQGYAEEGELQEVVIWGTQLSASNIVRDEEFIEIRQADHISDLLRTVPGVDVGGAHSLNQRITIRSMDDKDLQITIDGASQNSYMYHHMGNLQIHSDILKAVDISVGTNSIVDGGLGGAVHFFTKDAMDLLEAGKDLGGRASLSYASNDQLAYSLSGYGKLTESFDFLVYANQVDRNNYKVGGGAILDENGDEVEGTDGTVRGLEGELFDGLLKLGWNISDHHRITLGYENYKDEGDYSYRPDMGLTTDLAIANTLNISLLFPTEFTRETATLNYFGGIGESTTVRFSLYDSSSNFWRDETDLASWRPPFATVNEGDAKNSGARLNFESSFGSDVEHQLVYGGETNRYETQYIVDGVELSSEFSQNAAIYIQDRIQIGPQWAFVPGVRYDNVNVESKVVDDVFDEVSGAFAIEFLPAENYLFKLSSTQLFKAPEIGEVFTGAGLYDVKNPNIEAETGVNSEFSFAYKNQGLNAGFTLFKTLINDYIYDYIPGPNRTNIKDNVGDMEIIGREVYFGYSDSKLNALITFSDANSELSAFDEYRDDLHKARLDRSQGFTTSINVDYTFEEYDLKLLWESLLVDSLPAGIDMDPTSDDSKNHKDSYSVHNIAVRWSPGSVYGLDVTAGIDNILDEYYASQSSRTGVSGHPLFGDLYLTDVEPGRSFKLSVAYRF